jgi:hypothetical protein
MSLPAPTQPRICSTESAYVWTVCRQCDTLSCMTKSNRGAPQPMISMRFPIPVIEFLDALVEVRSDKAGERLHRADVIAWLLERVAPPSAPASELERRLRDTHHHAFKKETS